MKTLIVEDDFTSRLLLQEYLSRYGDCHIAVNGREAVDAFRAAGKAGAGYDLICLDIMLPEMDGQEALTQIRAAEEANGMISTDVAAVRIVMTSALDDVKTVSTAFRGLCDAYLVKPIDLSVLQARLEAFGLIS